MEPGFVSLTSKSLPCPTWPPSKYVELTWSLGVLVKTTDVYVHSLPQIKFHKIWIAFAFASASKNIPSNHANLVHLATNKNILCNEFMSSFYISQIYKDSSRSIPMLI